MKIQDFIPIFIQAESEIKPNPLITIIFNTQYEAEYFQTNYLINSSLKLKLSINEKNNYEFQFLFPKQNNYKLSIEVVKSNNKTYQNIQNKNLEVTCGFIISENSIGKLSPGYILDNKISLN